jgi:uncharacterized beta-barrel protein YwiB (DUF1934 family)
MTDVIVTVSGKQRDETGEETCLELITPGRWAEKNGVRYIVYDDSELSGMAGTTTVLKIYENRVVLVRKGSIEGRLEFDAGRQTVGYYKTPYGMLLVEIITGCLKISLNNDQYNVKIEYELAINGQWQSSNTLSVKVREEKKSGNEDGVTASDSESC